MIIGAIITVPEVVMVTEGDDFELCASVNETKLEREVTLTFDIIRISMFSSNWLVIVVNLTRA